MNLSDADGKWWEASPRVGTRAFARAHVVQIIHGPPIGHTIYIYSTYIVNATEDGEILGRP